MSAEVDKDTFNRQKKKKTAKEEKKESIVVKKKVPIKMYKNREEKGTNQSNLQFKNVLKN